MKHTTTAMMSYNLMQTHAKLFLREMFVFTGLAFMWGLLWLV